MSGNEEEMVLQQKESIAKKLVFAEFIFISAVGMVIPTRAPIVLGLKKGDAVATGKILGMMSSSAAFIELFINPVFGQLSDMFGRKPFFLIPPAIDAFLHALVGVFPSILPINFIDRMITGSMIIGFKAPLTASLSDLFTGAELAKWLAKQNAAFGLGLGVGPLLGATIGGAKSFIWSAVLFVATAIYTLTVIPETLKIESRKREFNIEACSPVRFLKLFRDRTTAKLTLVVGMQSFGDWLNLYDLNYLFLKKVFDVGQTGIGNYASASGISAFISGQTMAKFIGIFGQKGATLFSNTSWAVSMALFGTASSLGQVGASLVAMCFGHARNAAVTAYIQERGQAAGMGKSEIAAAQANFLALLKVFIPIFYANIFVRATSHGRNMPGAPYIVVALITALSQLLFSATDPDKISMKAKGVGA